MLIVVTLIWGVSFSLSKNWQEAAKGWPGGGLLAGLTLIALRTSLAVVLLIAFQPKLIRQSTRREHLSGAAIGVVFAVSFVLQTWGLATTTPGPSRRRRSGPSSLTSPRSASERRLP